MKPFIHHLTADDEVLLTLPEGHEAPWTIDLHGTTPASLALGKCIDAAQITLPPPFRPPLPVGLWEARTAKGSLLVTSWSGGIASVFPPDNSNQTATVAPDTTIAAPPIVSQLETTQPASDQSGATYTYDPPPSASPKLPTALSTIESGNNTLLGMGSILLISIIAGLIALYFIPYMVGSSRKIENQFLLFVTNLLFGWFGCLLWAALAQNGLDRALYRKMLRDEQ